MSGAADEACSRKRTRSEDGGDGEASRTGTDVDMPMAVAAAASAPASGSVAATNGAVALDSDVHAAAGTAATTSAPSLAAAQHAHVIGVAEVQPLPEQMRKKPRRSPRFCSPLDRLAKVELQLVLQFLDSDSRLKAARCCRRLLQAADDPFVWRGPAVSVSTRHQTQVGSLIRSSLLRHAPIALTLQSDLSAAEVAVIPRLRELTIQHGYPAGLAPQVLSLPTLQGLQVLRVDRKLPGSALQLLPTLCSLHTLEWRDPDDFADWRWLLLMPTLTDLGLTSCIIKLLSQSLIDAVGQCAQLRSLRLSYPQFAASNFVRLCATPVMRQLRHLTLNRIQAQGAELAAEDYRAAFSTLASLQSLRLEYVYGVDLLLPQVIHAPALLALTIAVRAQCPTVSFSSHPSCEALRQLLTAAPRLEVRLAVAGSIDKWRQSFRYTAPTQTEAGRERMDDQWRDLQRVAAEMAREGVVIVELEEPRP